MRRTIEGKVAGLVSGNFKETDGLPVVLDPCQHLIVRNGLIKKSLTIVHGGTDGTTTVEQIGL